MSSFPDYYAILNISSTATTEQIRQAYKRESLKSHPDRLVNATPEERKRATEKFQTVADAYYVLSDDTRRREYDDLRNSRKSKDRTTDSSASDSFFANFANMFAGPSASAPGGADPNSPRPDADNVFGDVFEELLRPEVQRHGPWWAWLGAAAGAAIGFIIGNVPGFLIGGYAGNRLGAVRDAKGRSVAAVFSQLGGSQKAEILRALAMKVLGSAGF